MPPLLSQVPVDKIVSAYSDGGFTSLSFGLLLLYFLWERRDDRKNMVEERKAQDVERAKFITITEQAITTLKTMERSLETLAHDVGEIKRWRDGQGQR